MEQLIFTLEILGIIVFSVLGAIESINRKLDAFGVLFCSVVSALGGGIVRDLLLGRVPPVMFTNYIYLVFAAVSSVLTFAFIYRFGKSGTHFSQKTSRIINIFDAAGLAAFTIVGIDTAVLFGHGDNAFFAVFLGMTTAVGGGIARDIFLCKIPGVFTKRIYAAASILGGVLYFVLSQRLFVPTYISVIVSVAAIMLLRILASYFRWNLPKVK